MNVLIISPFVPYQMMHGGALRVLNLSRELARRHKVSLLALDGTQQELDELRVMGVYNELSLFTLSETALSWRRLWRLSNRDYNKNSCSTRYQAVVDSIIEKVENYNIDIVLAVTLRMSEYIRDLKGVKRVVDDYDCNTLTIERELNAGSAGLFDGLLAMKLLLLRTKNHESMLVKDFDGVMTISPVDRKALAKLNGVRDESIGLIPNGVANELLDRGKSAGCMRRAVAFWGKLDFPPNRSAVEYFFNSIFKPYLSREDVHWYLIGEARTWSPEQMIGDVPNITVMGYVDDLYSLIEEIPIMINPMVMGSGLKNKVLEAFMLRCGVVSTSLGVESIEVEDGVHCAIHDDPEAFASSILNLLNNPEQKDRLAANGAGLIRSSYTWTKVGERFENYLENIVRGQSAM